MNAKHRVPNASPNAPTAPPSPPVPPSSADEIVATLHKIGELRDGGVLTTEEFEAKKAELLSRL
ncbi:SHOCT domain-containing protein [Microbacterium sp. GXF7504]